MKTAEAKFKDSRPDILVKAVYYNLIDKDILRKYDPHFLMFGRFYVETILRTEDKQWQVFNKKNFPDIYKKVHKILKSFEDKENLKPIDIYEMVYKDRGIYSGIIDPIPKQLFYLGMSEECDLSFKHDLSVVVQHSLPHWIYFYSNLRLFKYHEGFVRVSLSDIRDSEGYEEFTYLMDDEEMDYSMYKR